MSQAPVALPVAFTASLLISAATFLLPLPLTARWFLRCCPWILLPVTSLLKLSLVSPLSRGAGRPRCLLPIVLPRCGVTRLVTVLLAVKRMLLLPVTAPVLAPAWRCIRPPSAKVPGRPPVVADRNSQDEYRYHLRPRDPPRPVVPGAGVPGIPLVDPVQAVVKEIVCLHARSVIDRVARHRDQFRVQGQVDPDAHVRKPDADAHLSDGRGHRAQHHPQHNQSSAHFSVLQFDYLDSIRSGPAAALIAALALAVALAGVPVTGLVFGGLHEVHRPLAGVVLVAVLRPVPGMPRGHMHVDRRHDHRPGLLDDHHRLRIQDGRRRPVADVDAPVYPRLDLALDAYPDADIGGLHQSRAGGEKTRRDQRNSLVHLAVSRKKRSMIAQGPESRNRASVAHWRQEDARRARNPAEARACRARPRYPACDRRPTGPEERPRSARGASARPRCRGTSFRLRPCSSAAPGSPARRRPRSKCAFRRRGSRSRASEPSLRLAP